MAARSTSLSALGGAWRPLLETSFAALRSQGLDVSSICVDAGRRELVSSRLCTLLDLVVTWNARLDLTAARDVGQLLDLYLADALMFAVHAAAGGDAESWVDVGSGGGAPGLVLGVLRPDLKLTLVEPRQKRVAFLRTAVGTLGLGAVSIVGARSDALPAGSADVAISRATFSPPEWLVEGARLARRAVWVLLARGDAPELPHWRRARSVEYEWPSSRAPRQALELVRS